MVHLRLVLGALIAAIFLAGPGQAKGPHKAIEIKVLSYNINGLPAPIKTGKTPYYKRIADVLRHQRAAGTQPDVVLLQEAFDSRSDIIAETTGYKYVLKGPGRKDTSQRGDAHWVQKTRKAYASFSDPQKFLGSGLWILSDYPIVAAQHKAFNSDECAGFDCLANKSILLARIQVPGLAQPLDIINSHFNSRSAAKGPKKFVLLSHYRQTDTLKWFLGKTEQGNARIVAGDFNTRQAKRYDYFKETIGFADAGVDCLADSVKCTVAEGTRVEELLFNTNDKQFYKNGGGTEVVPVAMGRNFDEMLNGKPLSDHLGYEVVYKLISE
jgi:endonuclease/exonuclease/phosphatase family metal-dependent hydrolase